jgi:hypothetical protein
MRKSIMISLSLLIVLSFGAAFGSDSRIPQHVQDKFSEQGIKANYFMWFPIVPQMSTMNWSNILIISNFNPDPITVNVWFTVNGNEQTIKTYTLEFYGKKIVTLGTSGFGDNLYDIYCSSDQFFGAEVLLLEGGKIATAWPPIY